MSSEEKVISWERGVSNAGCTVGLAGLVAIVCGFGGMFGVVIEAGEMCQSVVELSSVHQECMTGMVSLIIESDPVRWYSSVATLVLGATGVFVAVRS